MRGTAWLSLVCGAACSAACLVKSFDVEPEKATSGGSSNGGVSNNGGTESSGADAGADSGSGGSSTLAGGSAGNNGIGGSTAGGGTAGSATAGSMSAGGDTGAGGDGGAGIGIRRIGFSLFHDSASGDDQASSHLADATFAKPAGTAAGDLMLVLFGCDHELMNINSTTLEPAGWTLIDQHEQYGTDGQGTYLLYRIADGKEPDSIVFSGINNLPYGNGVQGLLSVYRGVNQASPVNAYQVKVVPQGTSNTKHVVTPTPAITTTVDDCLLIAGLSPDSQIDAPVIAAWPNGFDENPTSVVNPPNPYPNAWANIYTVERHLSKAGTVPASSFTWDMTYDGTEYFGALSFVLALTPQ